MKIEDIEIGEKYQLPTGGVITVGSVTVMSTVGGVYPAKDLEPLPKYRYVRVDTEGDHSGFYKDKQEDCEKKHIGWNRVERGKAETVTFISRYAG